MALCFHLEAKAQDLVIGIPDGWIVNGQEVKDGILSGISDSALVVLTPTKNELKRVKSIKVKSVEVSMVPETDVTKNSEDYSTDNVETDTKGHLSLGLTDVTMNHLGWITAGYILASKTLKMRKLSLLL